MAGIRINSTGGISQRNVKRNGEEIEYVLTRKNVKNINRKQEGMLLQIIITFLNNHIISKNLS